VQGLTLEGLVQLSTWVKLITSSISQFVENNEV
jgi:hypothetical protein